MNRLFRVIILLILLPLISCSREIQPPFRIGVNNWLGYAPLIYAQKQGFYQNSGVKIVQLPSSSETIHAFRMGNLEAAALTLDEALTLLQDDIKLSAILIFDISNGADALISKPEIKTLAELKGKRIGVESSAVGALTLDYALTKAGLSPDEINIVSCSYERHAECYNQLDAVVTFEPTKTQLLAIGGHNLFDSWQMPGKIIDLLVVSKNTIQARPNAIQHAVDGYFRAIMELKEHPQQAYSNIESTTTLNYSEIETVLDGLLIPDRIQAKDILSGHPAQLEVTAQGLVKSMSSHKLLKREFTISELADDQFIR